MNQHLAPQFGRCIKTIAAARKSNIADTTRRIRRLSALAKSGVILIRLMASLLLHAKQPTCWHLLFKLQFRPPGDDTTIGHQHQQQNAFSLDTKFIDFDILVPNHLPLNYPGAK